jgi:hypothetical protein
MHAKEVKYRERLVTAMPDVMDNPFNTQRAAAIGTLF